MLPINSQFILLPHWRNSCGFSLKRIVAFRFQKTRGKQPFPNRTGGTVVMGRAISEASNVVLQNTMVERVWGVIHNGELYTLLPLNTAKQRLPRG